MTVPSAIWTTGRVKVVESLVWKTRLDTRWPLGCFENQEQSSVFFVRLRHPNFVGCGRLRRDHEAFGLWKEISGQDLDALLVTDSEILQQKAVSAALPTEKRLRIDMALLRQGLRRG
jgi:hypothetical protein